MHSIKINNLLVPSSTFLNTQITFLERYDMFVQSNGKTVCKVAKDDVDQVRELVKIAEATSQIMVCTDAYKDVDDGEFHLEVSLQDSIPKVEKQTLELKKVESKKAKDKSDDDYIYEEESEYTEEEGQSTGDSQDYTDSQNYTDETAPSECEVCENCTGEDCKKCQEYEETVETVGTVKTVNKPYTEIKITPTNTSDIEFEVSIKSFGINKKVQINAETYKKTGAIITLTFED